MRYIHSKSFIHRDLKPENIFLDWDWIVRIGDFSHSLQADTFGSAKPDEALLTHPCLSIGASYTAPECFNNEPTLESDVFSFGLILYELLVGVPGFSLYYPRQQERKILDKERPPIPDFIRPEVGQLIRNCWKPKHYRRPSFVDILWRLRKMDFKIMDGVNCAKVRKFVRLVQNREKMLGIEINDFDE
jgi:serine/threonine protein kinase